MKLKRFLIVFVVLIITFVVFGCNNSNEEVVEFEGFTKVSNNVYVSNKLIEKGYEDVGTQYEIDFLRNKLQRAYDMSEYELAPRYISHYIRKYIDKNRNVYYIEFDYHKTYLACAYFNFEEEHPSYNEIKEKDIIWVLYLEENEVKAEVFNNELKHTFKVTYGNDMNLLANEEFKHVCKYYGYKNDLIDFKCVCSHLENLEDNVIRLEEDFLYDEIVKKGLLLTEEDSQLYIKNKGFWGNEYYHKYKTFAEYSEHVFEEFYGDLMEIVIVDNESQTYKFELNDFVDFIKKKRG